MRYSRLAGRVVTVVCAWAAALPLHAQEWQLEQQRNLSPTAFGSAAINQAGMVRSVRVTEGAPGVFTVQERTPFGAAGVTMCIARPRSARLASAGGRQILSIAPAIPGCAETRLVIEPDGSGWEEENSGGQWVATGARLAGHQQVSTSRPMPELPAMAMSVPVPAPAPQAGPVAAPAATAPAPATVVAVAPQAAQPWRDSPALAPMPNRRALVIGNDNYRHVARLLNARSDARAMGRALERAGFQVTTSLDADERGLKQALRDFRASVQGGDEVIVFYSGHGVQVGGTNYLLPVDMRGENEEQVRDEAVPLQRILDDLSDKRARFMLAVIDACRDNPFKDAVGRAIGGRGLAPTTAATGQMVIYAAGSGQQALDRLGPADRSPNGLFTRVFLREMEAPGVPIDRVLRSVRSEVVRLARAVGHEQTPALYDQTVGDFYLRPSP